MATKIRRKSVLTKHLKEIELSYFEHLRRAWTVSFVSFVHGLFPFIWETKAKDIINGDPKDFKVKHDD